MKNMILIAAFLIGDAAAQTTISPNPLAGLPGPQGAQIAQIQSLGDNQWLNLGAPAGDPVYGRARGCSWGGKSMVLAPDLRGAFRTGEGWHAYVKPDGFGQDDYWFYDINGHRWICLYPGTDTGNFNQCVGDSVIYVDSAGRVVDTLGQPIPGHLLIHAFGCITYDTDLKKFTFVSVNARNGFNRYYMPGVSAIEEGLAELEAQGLNKTGYHFSPWTYNTLTGKFERDLAANAMPNLSEPWPMFLYIPGKRKFFAAGPLGITLFEPATRTWSGIITNTATPGGWSLACYDSKRDRVYGGVSADEFYRYDVNAQVMTKIANSAACSLSLNNNNSALVYDSINDVVLLLAFWKNSDTYFRTGVVFPFDPGTDTWGTPVPFDAAFSSAMHETNAAFYDPALGVVFIYTAGDSYDNGVMWAYRYRTGPAAIPRGKTASLPEADALCGLPNPLAGNVEIRLPAGAWKAYNLRGEQVADLSGRAVWHTGGLSAGVYLLKVKTSAGTFTLKRVLQR